jgi:hypothetical protein
MTTVWVTVIYSPILNIGLGFVVVVIGIRIVRWVLDILP